MSEKLPPLTLWEAINPGHSIEEPEAWMSLNDQQMNIPNPEELIIGEIPAGKRKLLPLKVDFSEFHRSNCLKIGQHSMERHINSKLDGRKGRFNILKKDDERVNHMGTCGEVTIAITTNRFYSFRQDTFDTFADLCGEEIKTRGLDPRYKHMLVNPDKLDDPTKIYWLVIGDFPVFRNWGWTTGWHLKKFGKSVKLGPFTGFGIHRDLLFQWLPDFDPYHYVKDQVQQQTLNLDNPWKAEPIPPEEFEFTNENH